MQKKLQSIIPKKMLKDLSANYFLGDAAFDLRNIRINSTEETTFMSLTNEKSNALTDLLIGEAIVGWTYVDDYVVLFSTGERTHTGIKDCIYKIYIDDNQKVSTHIYYYGLLGFNRNTKVECVVSIEAPSIHKVYWVDGLNELRVINTKLETDSGVKDAVYNESHFFEITPKNLKLEDSIKVNKILNSGLFSQGVILYAYSYYNYNGKETPLINCSCLNYISTELGIASDKLLECSFEINLYNLDISYEYVRIYSILRTSLNSTPLCRRVTDIKIEKTKVNPNVPNSPYTSKVITFIDDGIMGNTEDYNLLKFLGADKIVASTIASKDNTLFLGNIKETTNFIPEQDRIDLAVNSSVKFLERQLFNMIPYTQYKGNLLNNADSVLTFKKHETYRIGILFLFEDGSLSEVVCLKDIKFTPKGIVGSDGQLSLNTKGEVEVNISTNILLHIEAVRARLMFVYPTLNDRSRVTLGIISPTVFEVKARATNYLHSQPSWLIRDLQHSHYSFINNEIQGASERPSDLFLDLSYLDNYLDDRFITVKYWYEKSNTYKPWNTFCFLDLTDNKIYEQRVYVDLDSTGDIAYNKMYTKMINMYGRTFPVPTKEKWMSYTSKDLADTISFRFITNYFKGALLNVKTDSSYYVDTSLVTLYSPELEESTDFLRALNPLDLELVGVAKVSNTYNDALVTASNTLRDVKELGMISNFPNNKLLTCLPLWNDVTPDSNVVSHVSGHCGWVFDTYMWHRNGSLNADKNGGNTGVYALEYDKAYSLLKSKRFVNVRDCMTEYFKVPSEKVSCDFKIHLNDYEGFYNLNGIFYKGVIDSLVAHNKEYPITGVKVSDSLGVWDSLLVNQPQYVTSKGDIVYSRDPVHIKYKSANHIFLNLKDRILPHTKNHIVDGKLDLIQLASLKNLIVVREVLNPKDLPTNALTEIAEGDCFLLLDTVNGKNIFNSFKVVSEIRNQQITYIETPLIDFSYPERTVHFNFNLLVRGDLIDIPNKLQKFGVYNVETTSLYDDGHSKPAPEFKITSLKNLKLTEISLQDPLKTNLAIYIGDITRDLKNQYFGGQKEVLDGTINKDGNEIMSLLVWTPIGNFYNIEETIDRNLGEFIIYGNRGDTYFLRWDCLATKPYALEDKNLVIDIVSCYLESRLNLDGRTDVRGDTSININSNQFNTINRVYSLSDNFQSIVNPSLKNEEHYFPTNIVFSQPKGNNTEIDNWTKIKAISSTNADSKYGEITKILNYNNTLYFLLPKALGAINFNSRVLVHPSDGVPIEIANNGRVDGVTYISNTTGCSNKGSIVETALGVYYVDDYNKSIVRFNPQGSLELSLLKSMKSWIDNNVNKGTWPNNTSAVRTLYDINTRDVYFTTDKEALAYNETLLEFTSFYSYLNVSQLFSLNGKSYLVYTPENSLNVGIYEIQGGSDYLIFFGEKQDYEIALISGDVFQLDKVFENIEFRTTGIEEVTYGKASEYPFYSLEVSNEYLKSIANTSSLKKKFRVWRWQISKTDTRDRIRNNWALYKLKGNLNKKVLIFDFMTTFYI